MMEGPDKEKPRRRARRSEAVVDLPAVIAYVTRLSDELERAWADALDLERLGELDARLLSDWHAIVSIIQIGADASDQELGALGRDSSVPPDPFPVEQVPQLQISPDLQESRRQLQQAQATAFEMVMTAVQNARKVGPRPPDRITGEAAERWFESGAFALVRSRAGLLTRVTDILEQTETELVREAHGDEPAQDSALEVPPFLTHRRLAAEALARGDVEASLLHLMMALRRLIAALADIEPEMVGGSLASWLGDTPEAGVVAKLEELFSLLPIGLGRALGAALIVARTMLAVLDRLIASPPVREVAIRLERGMGGG